MDTEINIVTLLICLTIGMRFILYFVIFELYKNELYNCLIGDEIITNNLQ